MVKLLELGIAYLQDLVHYPRVEIFGVFAFAVLVPFVALACICLRDHFRNGDGALRRHD
jgi:hypothetical protein